MAIKFTRTLQQASLFYGPGEPQLIPGKKYAVRVRAFNTDGLEIFKNNGYSEVRVFQFGETCNSPISFDLNDETQSTFNIEVQSDPSNTAWQANFRESGSSDWSELKAEGASSEKTVRGLKASTTYEVQLKGLCGPFASDFTFSKTITTMERTNTERICENTASPFVVTNALPLPQLKKEHIFLAALVPIKVSQVTKQGGGKFSGNGIATLPFFNAGLAVTFDDIQINELMQLTSGEVNVVRNAFNPTFFGDELPPTDGTGGGSNPDSTGNGTWPPFTDTITINVPFDSIVVVNDSTIWVIPSGGGEAIVVDLGGSTCTLILPSDGNLNNAQVVYNGAARPYNSSNSNDGSLDQFTGFLANFEPSPMQAYGFDSLKYSGFADYYNEMDVNGKVFKMPWKALAPNSYEPVNLKIRRSSDSFPYSDLKVGIWGGDNLVPVAGSNTELQTYNLKGTNEGDEYAIVAKFNSDDKEVHAGGIWTVTYQPKSFNLYIVALEGSNIDEECARMQNEITTIYKQALVSWSVKPLYGFKGIALGDNGIDWTNSELLSAYNTEMNSVISAFKDWHPNSDPDAYYMIVVPKFSDNTVEGFMPRNRRFGFISAEQLYSRNVAHELGHGAFNLRHTFPEVTKSSTDNLMDYTPDKFALLKAQWDLIHNPESTTGLFDEMEDGASKQAPFEIHLFDGSAKKGQDSILLITTVPAMPDIRVKIVSASNKGKYKVKLEIKYQRQCTGPGVGRTPNQLISFPSTDWNEVDEGTEWDIDFGNDATTQRPMIRGGIAYLIAESPNKQKDTLRFFIKGTNPTVQTVNAFLDQAPYNTIWFFKKIIFHESGSPGNLSEQAKQFNLFNQGQENLTESNWNAYSRLPNFGAPCGWGLGQMDNPAPPAQALWDWQANIRSAYDVIINKQNAVNTHLNNCNEIVTRWNEPGRPIVTKPDTIEGGITYTHASSLNFTHAINAHLGNAPTGNNRSYIDACWIKLYNGRGDNHYYYLVDGNRNTPPTWHICNFSTWTDKNGIHYNYYVRDIGNRVTP